MGGEGSGRKPDPVKLLTKRNPPVTTSVSNALFIPNLSGDHSAGNLQKTPTQDLDLVNKKYVDDSISSSGFVTYTGATQDVDLGDNQLSAGLTNVSIPTSSGSSASVRGVQVISKTTTTNHNAGIKFGVTTASNLCKSAIVHQRKSSNGQGDMVFLLDPSTDGSNVDFTNEVLRFEGNTGNPTFTGILTAANISGTNTGDQDLSGFITDLSSFTTDDLSEGSNNKYADEIYGSGQISVSNYEVKLNNGSSDWDILRWNANNNSWDIESLDNHFSASSPLNYSSGTISLDNGSSDGDMFYWANSQWNLGNPFSTTSPVNYDASTRTFSLSTGTNEGDILVWDADTSAWIIDAISNYAETDHANLDNLNWANAGHTIDTDFDLNGQDVISGANVTLGNGESNDPLDITWDLTGGTPIIRGKVIDSTTPAFYIQGVFIDTGDYKTAEVSGRYLFDANGYTSIDWGSHLLGDGSNSLNWSSRELIASDGSNSVFSWDTDNDDGVKVDKIYKFDGTLAIDVENNSYYDQNENLAMNYNDKIFFRDGVGVLDYGSGYLTDENNALAISWFTGFAGGNRKLIADDGATESMSWNNGSPKLPDYTAVLTAEEGMIAWDYSNHTLMAYDGSSWNAVT